MAEISPAPIDINVYLLTDHLDAALASGEDLCQQSVFLYPATPGTGTAALLRQQAELTSFVSGVYALELSLTLRLLQARHRIAELRAMETRFKPYFSAFIGGTASLVDAAEGFSRAGSEAFKIGQSPLAFLISRGLLPVMTPRLPHDTHICVNADYLIAGEIPLGPLMDMLASFLDGLELAFELYPRDAKALADIMSQVPQMVTPLAGPALDAASPPVDLTRLREHAG
jgi:hypothetical protein